MILGHLKGLNQRMTPKDIGKRGFTWVMEDDRKHGKAAWKIVGDVRKDIEHIETQQV
jgi:hypothetical protein